jgi:hypothetical protein
MRRNALLVGPGLIACVVVASCGARTGLELKPRHDAGRDAPSHDATFDVGLDAPRDVEHIPDVIPSQDGHFLDAKADCDSPTYCKPDDPNYIYKCGVRIFQCGSLEQCEERCGDGGTETLEAGADASGCTAKCVNPCLDTLGQNTSNGCEFYAAEMDMIQSAVGVCYAVFVVNQWNTGEPAKLEVDLGGTQSRRWIPPSPTRVISPAARRESPPPSRGTRRPTALATALPSTSSPTCQSSPTR